MIAYLDPGSSYDNPTSIFNSEGVRPGFSHVNHDDDYRHFATFSSFFLLLTPFTSILYLNVIFSFVGLVGQADASNGKRLAAKTNTILCYRSWLNHVAKHQRESNKIPHHSSH